MKKIATGLIATLILNGCGIKQAIQRSDAQYMTPGALDAPLSSSYITYTFKFMDRYRVTYDGPVDGGCRYHGVTEVPKSTITGGSTYYIRDIFEEDGKTWLRAVDGRKPLNLDRYFRSVKTMQPLYKVVNGVEKRTGEEEEVEVGLQSTCFQSWYVSGHTLIVRIHKRDIDTWRAQWSAYNPRGRWSMQHVEGNDWWLLANDEDALLPAPPGGTGGWFQSWVMPIGDTGYSMSIQLGANQKSLQSPKAHEQMKATLRHMVESVKIEALP